MVSWLVSWLVPGWCSSGPSWVSRVVAHWGNECPEFTARPNLKMLLILTYFILLLFFLLQQANSLYYTFLLPNYFKLPSLLSYRLCYLLFSSHIVAWLNGFISTSPIISWNWVWRDEKRMFHLQIVNGFPTEQSKVRLHHSETWWLYYIPLYSAETYNNNIFPFSSRNLEKNKIFRNLLYVEYGQSN